MSLSLVVLAAGVGSRYGGPKQIDRVGPGGATLIDYSIYDARRAGFERAVLVVGEGREADMREAVGDRAAHYASRAPAVTRAPKAAGPRSDGERGELGLEREHVGALALADGSGRDHHDGPGATARARHGHRQRHVVHRTPANDREGSAAAGSLAVMPNSDRFVHAFNPHLACE